MELASILQRLQAIHTELGFLITLAQEPPCMTLHDLEVIAASYPHPEVPAAWLMKQWQSQPRPSGWRKARRQLLLNGWIMKRTPAGNLYIRPTCP